MKLITNLLNVHTFVISFVQGCAVNGGGSCASQKSNLLDDVMREKILVS